MFRQIKLQMAGFSLAAFVTLTGSVAIGSVQAFASASNQLKIAGGKEIESLDPILIDGADAQLVATGLFEGLTVNDPKTLEPKPGLAQSWKVSEKGKKITLELRKGLKWSDGSSLTAQDFLYAWERALKAENGAYHANLFDAVEGAESFRKAKPDSTRNFAKVGLKAPSANTLVIQLHRPFPAFLGLLSMPVFAPVKKSNVESGKNWTQPGNLLSSGPYVLHSWKLKDKLELTLNSHYHNAANVSLKSITVIPVDDAKTAWNLYETGQVHWTRRVPLGQMESLRKRSDFHISPMLNTVYYWHFLSSHGLRWHAQTRGQLGLPCFRRCSRLRDGPLAIVFPSTFLYGEATRGKLFGRWPA
jgi:oligopeptide transport system substrate-binding protein